jgi:hypothetical protein
MLLLGLLIHVADAAARLVVVVVVAARAQRPVFCGTRSQSMKTFEGNVL